MVEKQRLGLLFECHRFVVNLDVNVVERLVLSDELKELPSHHGTRVVAAGGEPYAAFNLGRLLGLAPTTGAAVLVRAAFAGGPLRLCLETGPCLLVRQPPRATPLGPGLFRARRRALEAAFALPSDLAARSRSPVGFSLSIDGLLNAAERDAAAKAIRATRDATAPTP